MNKDRKNNNGRRCAARRLARSAMYIALTAILTVTFCATALLVYACRYSKSISTEAFTELARTQDQTTHLYYISYRSEDGKSDVATELPDQSLYSSQNREWVSYANIPDNLKNAFVAIEDHRFFTHSGIDLRRTAGAILGYLRGGRTYGGSTVTQQLIKNVTGNDEYSVSRKLHEILFALKLDKALSKEEILELYLNTIYLSDSCYGVGSAAEYYFGHECDKLTLEECAALACIPQCPSKWNPRTNPQNNKSRRETVLTRMAELGYITEAERDSAAQKELNVVAKKRKSSESQNDKRYSWYTEAVIDESVELLVSRGIAANRQTATKMLYSGGLSIITAQNPDMQRIAERYFADDRNFKHQSGALITPECSTVIIDPSTGNILALVGGRGEKKDNRILNYATATKRSPGSSIKPLSVYAPAIDRGKITYGTVIDDTPYTFNGGKRPWPYNSPRGYRGLTTVRDAVSRSVNTVAVKVLNKVGKQEVFDLLHNRLGMTGLIDSRVIGGESYTDIADSPLAHGQLTAGVTVKEITGAYTALCNGGIYHRPRTVLKIYDSNGKLLIDNADEGDRVFSPETATVMTKLLQGVTKNGTAKSVKLKNRIACAGKTGTTNANCDKWFIGYTPDLLCGVWFGYATPKNLSGYSGTVNPALKVWDDLMTELSTEELLGHAPTKRFPDNPNIVTATYCRDSGKRVTAACLADPRGSRVETGYFTRDTVPREYCDCHVLVRYDTVNHGVAGQDCPDANCRTVGMIRVNRSFPVDVTVADSQYVYRGLDGNPPCLNATEPFFLNALKKGQHVGHSSTSSPFNRFCHKCYFAARSPSPPDQEQTDSTAPGEYEDESF
ncbi:MAG: PBP1A family penicillin-binding protein [Clostridia bacterium]|nr:PBP1A family penicillin-binding protein [Clostridia bacterium]